MKRLADLKRSHSDDSDDQPPEGGNQEGDGYTVPLHFANAKQSLMV